MGLTGCEACEFEHADALEWRVLVVGRRHDGCVVEIQVGSRGEGRYRKPDRLLSKDMFDVDIVGEVAG